MDIPIKQYDVISSGERKVGVIAQDLQLSYPELVSDMGDGTLGVSPPSVWELILTIQNQQSQIDMLKSELCLKDKTYNWCK